MFCLMAKLKKKNVCVWKASKKQQQQQGPQVNTSSSP